VTCDVRLFHRRAAATRNVRDLSPTVDRRVRRTSRDVDEATFYYSSAGRRLTICLKLESVLLNTVYNIFACNSKINERTSWFVIRKSTNTPIIH